jgi:hypothetical protein
MALTVASVSGVKDVVVGNLRAKTVKVTFDSSYATAGEAITAANVGLKTIWNVIVTGPFYNADYTSAVDVRWNRTTGKLVAYWGNAGTASVSPEVSSTTDLSAYNGEIIVLGY